MALHKTKEQTDRTAERLLQRCVHQMPNVLFVITGRNRLDWTDIGVGAELDFAGAQFWPGLHYDNSIEPRRHLVGYLSESDADHFLRAALTRNGEPAMCLSLGVVPAAGPSPPSRRRVPRKVRSRGCRGLLSQIPRASSYRMVRRKPSSRKTRAEDHLPDIARCSATATMRASRLGDHGAGTRE